MTLRAGAWLVAAAALAVPSVAKAAGENGGVAPTLDTAGGSPTVECVATSRRACPAAIGSVVAGGRLRVVGDELSAGARIVFRGGPGRGDDVGMRAAHVGPRHVDATVPGRALSGPIEVIARNGRTRLARSAAIQVVPPGTAAPRAVDASLGSVFPIRGPHDLGQTATNAFGGGRGHQGVDMFASCGTPLVAATSGVVTRAVAGDAQAGNYAVLRDAIGQEQVYMHMRDPASVSEGSAVVAGQPLGLVGDSGNAQGCHLHFEVWPSGWQKGAPVDPLPLVRAWDPDH